MSGQHALNGGGGTMTGALWNRASLCKKRLSSSSERSLNFLPTNCPKTIMGSGGEKLRRRLADPRKRDLAAIDVLLRLPVTETAFLISEGQQAATRPEKELK